jgi:Tol biopolymer transport system component
MKTIYVILILALALGGCMKGTAPDNQVAQAATDTPLQPATEPPIATITLTHTTTPTLTSTPTDAQTPTPIPATATPDGPPSPYGDPFVLYSAPVGQDFQIFSTNLDEDPLKSVGLTEGNHVAYKPVWSPDGTTFAYLLYDLSTEQDRFNLLDFPPTAEPRQLSTQAVNIVGTYCWTFDQKYLIWSSNQPDGTEMDIYRLDVATGEIVDLTQASPVWDAFPACSPVNDKIAFVSERKGSSEENDNIWVMDSQGENLRQVTSAASGWESTYPGWSPDGSEIAYIKFGFPGFSDEAYGPDGVWAVKADGSDERLVVEIEDIRRGGNLAPAWSPDGSYIAYLTGADEMTTLRIVPASGGEPLWSSQLPGEKTDISWSANSLYLIFTNIQNKQRRIYILAITDPQPAPLLDYPYTFFGMFRPGRK